jgi:hypothetical protein
VLVKRSRKCSNAYLYLIADRTNVYSWTQSTCSKGHKQLGHHIQRRFGRRILFLLWRLTQQACVGLRQDLSSFLRRAILESSKKLPLVVCSSTTVLSSHDERDNLSKVAGKNTVKTCCRTRSICNMLPSLLSLVTLTHRFPTRILRDCPDFTPASSEIALVFFPLLFPSPTLRLFVITKWLKESGLVKVMIGQSSLIRSRWWFYGTSSRWTFMCDCDDDEVCSIYLLFWGYVHGHGYPVIRATFILIEIFRMFLGTSLKTSRRDCSKCPVRPLSRSL